MRRDATKRSNAMRGHCGEARLISLNRQVLKTVISAAAMETLHHFDKRAHYHWRLMSIRPAREQNASFPKRSRCTSAPEAYESPGGRRIDGVVPQGRCCSPTWYIDALGFFTLPKSADRRRPFRHGPGGTGCREGVSGGFKESALTQANCKRPF